ncbi:hypothetical protein OIU34_33925 [Pararhizobium sp. BT-229]|uniref:hypothetical protein n=1 Tax=Pararhizobium sp. BT-229 TaxID=2986923 RepID=UPI0021F7D343|nr:hypothetical protein [Pararhizobium sp. BT-229]
MKQVVEYQGIPVGVLIPRDGGLAFMAVKYDVMELDGRSFLSAAEARAAIRAHVNTTRRRPKDSDGFGSWPKHHRAVDRADRELQSQFLKKPNTVDRTLA